MSAAEHPPKTGVLLVNLGSPDAPTSAAVRRYLREFLWDRRVVDLPRPLWWAILHGFVLTFRPRKSAHAYRKIWAGEQAPLIAFTRQLSERLAEALRPEGIQVDMAMRYGKPSIAAKLHAFKNAGIAQFVIVPLYPQYSSTTTASVFDAVMNELQRWRYLPTVKFINEYYRHPAYIAACAQSIRAFRTQNGTGQKLLFSFHGLPAKLTEMGDPYYRQCLHSAAAIAAALQLAEHEWQCVFQSRFGRAEWLQPYCVEVLQQLPKQGVTAIDIVCPGFAVDCLETLEEIAITNKRLFIAAGGQEYRYIPALNADHAHVQALLQLLRQQPALRVPSVTPATENNRIEH
ncbi:MAG: ferrochelatase [Gammaproteobacteria bacterium]